MFLFGVQQPQMRRSVLNALALARVSSGTSALPINQSLATTGPGHVESRQGQAGPPPQHSRLFSSKLLASLHLTWHSASAEQQQQQQQQQRRGWHHAGEGDRGDRSHKGDRPRRPRFSLQERLEDHPHP